MRWVIMVTRASFSASDEHSDRLSHHHQSRGTQFVRREPRLSDQLQTPNNWITSAATAAHEKKQDVVDYCDRREPTEANWPPWNTVSIALVRSALIRDLNT